MLHALLALDDPIGSNPIYMNRSEALNRTQGAHGLLDHGCACLVVEGVNAV